MPTLLPPSAGSDCDLYSLYGIVLHQMSGDDDIRAAAFSWLAEQAARHGHVVPRGILQDGFEYRGQRVTLMGQPGIWKPRVLALPLSITTTPSGPYDDSFTEDGLLEYRYRGTDPHHRDNVGLRELCRTRTPLIYFHGVARGRYMPVWPVFIVEDRPRELCCMVAVEAALTLSPAEGSANVVGPDSIIGVRRYITGETKRRLHQTVFRERVLDAYSGCCSLCRLRHRTLLDAAHIVPDSDPRGEPVVPNGLCLCKIHHAAYDSDLIGISPDYTVHVRRDVRDETDGPMLLHGLQELHESRVALPNRRADRPDRDRLAWRYERFRAA
ncbi:MAG: HNH endonuclease [Gammaproteobacteria bacterium]|nr:HNH endonuclease [Gammaproteobacteria bacterium]